MNIPKEVARLLIGGSMLGGSFALYYVVTTNTYPPETQRTIDTIVGALIGGVSMVLGFYFGSSTGSEEKTQILANVVKKNEN